MQAPWRISLSLSSGRFTAICAKLQILSPSFEPGPFEKRSHEYCAVAYRWCHAAPDGTWQASTIKSTCSPARHQPRSQVPVQSTSTLYMIPQRCSVLPRPGSASRRAEASFFFFPRRARSELHERQRHGLKSSSRQKGQGPAPPPLLGSLDGGVIGCRGGAA